MNEKVKIDITTTSIIRVLVILGLAYLLFMIRDVLVLIFIAGILVSAFAPIIKKWSERIGKKLSIALLVLLIVGSIVGFAYLIVPPFINQIKQLLVSLPELVNRFSIIRSHFSFY
jgi:predicted PurR-regulated permease PerM